MMRIPLALAVLLLASQSLEAQDPVGEPAGAAAGDAITARAELIDSTGATIGEVTLTETPGNGVVVELRASGLTAGVHALHIHETGRCDAPSFESAGGHYDPHGRAHGVHHPEGMHGGDMLNLHVPQGGEIEAERLARDVTLQADADGTLFDSDGSAVVIHAGADDYESQPSGDAGGRVACGVVTR